MTGGWGRRIAVGVAALGLLVAGSQLQDWLPGEHDEPAAEPFVRTGKLGETIDIRTATVTVDAVVGSKTLDEFGTLMESPGVWVVARYIVVAEREDTSIAFVELRDDGGRVWGLNGRNRNQCEKSPPDLAAVCFVHFEVPVDAVPSLRIRLARESLDTRYDVIAEVDLGLTAADAAAFEEAQPVDLPAARLGEEPQ